MDPHNLPTPFPPRLTTKPEHNRRARYLGLAFAMLLAAGSGFLGGYLGAGAKDNIDSSIAGSRQVISSESELIADIAKRVGPSVVSIDVTSQSTPQTLFEFYNGGGGIRASAGTGIILSEDGVIITNRHVVPAGATSVNITLADETIYEDVEVIGRTSENDSLDIAFLKIKDTKGKKLVPAKLGDSTKMEVGDRVVAIGNALGEFQNTVTSGIISGFGRSVEAGTPGDSESLVDLFQTDAAINSGNSGRWHGPKYWLCHPQQRRQWLSPASFRDWQI